MFSCLAKLGRASQVRVPEKYPATPSSEAIAESMFLEFNVEMIEPFPFPRFAVPANHCAFLVRLECLH
jgi:hypothetical protein